MWHYRVEGWSDPYGTWRHDALIKIAAGVDVELMLEEGARVFERALEGVDRSPEQRRILEDAISGLRDTSVGTQVRLDAGAGEPARTEMTDRPLREMISPSPAYPLLVERELALTGAWYEIFPRSEGAVRDPRTGRWRSGTLRTAAERLPAIADMGLSLIHI